MHILFLTDNFPPEVNAPASRTFEHACEWVKAGNRVTVITCAPNFPKGQLFDGYRNSAWQRETIEGIEVIRVWSYITANEGFIKRTLDYASFMASATLASPLAGRPDIVVATSPQFFTAVAGYLVSRVWRKPFVFELRDLWPESIRAVGAMQQSRILDWMERLELFLYRKADAVVSVTNAFRDDLSKRGIDSSKVHVVTNGVDLTRFQPLAKDEHLVETLGLRDRFIAGYVGTHGMAHALETLLEVAHKLQDEGREDVQLLLLGSGAQKAAIVSKAADMGLKNVTFIDTVPKEEVARYWSLLDVSIIHLRDTPLFSTVIPSKLFECMAMGIPVLHGVRGESANIVQQAEAGLVFEPENADALRDLLLVMASDRNLGIRFSKNGIKIAKKYNRKALAMDMLDVLEKVAAKG